MFTTQEFAFTILAGGFRSGLTAVLFAGPGMAGWLATRRSYTRVHHTQTDSRYQYIPTDRRSRYQYLTTRVHWITYAQYLYTLLCFSRCVYLFLSPHLLAFLRTPMI